MSLQRSGRPTQEGFDLLLQVLDEDREAAGRKYEGIRERLIRFFHWRGSLRCEDDADETIDRVIRRMEQRQPIDHVQAYVHGVARLVLLESLRKREQEERRNRLFLQAAQGRGAAAEPDVREGCLERCLAGLPAAERELILEYYRGDHMERIRARRALAERLGIPFDLLRLRAHRIRGRLEACLAGCLGTGLSSPARKRARRPRPVRAD